MHLPFQHGAEAADAPINRVSALRNLALGFDVLLLSALAQEFGQFALLFWALI